MALSPRGSGNRALDVSARPRTSAHHALGASITEGQPSHAVTLARIIRTCTAVAARPCTSRVMQLQCCVGPDSRELKFQRFILVRIVLHVEDLRNLHHGLLCRQVREVELLKSGFCRILGFA
eukprot:scaffold150236_cov36-Tisochrysis_lutea.AAC.2